MALPHACFTGRRFPDASTRLICLALLVAWPAVAAAQSGTITGAVRGVDGGTALPLPGVSVCYRDAYSSWGRCQTTDASGRYSFDLPALPPSPVGSGRYYVHTQNNLGYTDEVYNDVLCPNDCSSSFFQFGAPIALTAGLVFTADFALDRGGVITGTVTDASTSAPLAGVAIHLVGLETLTPPFRPIARRSAQTDASGGYAFQGLPAGRYYAFTCSGGSGWDCPSDLGYVNEYYDNIPCGAGCNEEDAPNGTPIDVALGATTSGRDFALDRGGRITGTITDALTTLPIADACVFVFDVVGEQVVEAGEDCADATGVYDVGGLPSGAYFAYAYAPTSGHAPELYDNIPCIQDGCRAFLAAATPIAVTLGTTTPGRDFALNPGGSVRGVVRDAVNSEPLPYVPVALVVRAHGAAWVVAEAQTNALGEYSVAGLPGGTYYAFTSHDNYLNEIYDDIPCPGGQCALSQLATAGTAIPVTTGTVTAGIDFGLRTDVPPAPPVGLGAGVDNYTVTLNWYSPLEGGLATSYVVEAGLAPGAPLLFLPTAQRYFVASPVGPGRYYVRVRAVNSHGTSAPSEEILVIVTANGADGSPPSKAPRYVQGWMSGPRLTLTWQRAYDGTGVPDAYVL
ncbi:MAG: carboxypeptidase regulatory-like domain-containing protein, partial [Acidobacteriota bacterium]|nr:carboxypeptidase regulatory-like domain-containing protein [Acidobacteriota bacterium]